MDPAVWYLVLSIAGAEPASENYVGPMTRETCERQRGGMQFPEVIKATCEKMVAAYACPAGARPEKQKVCPIFWGDPDFHPVGPR
jgi:hypothetical protein